MQDEMEKYKKLIEYLKLDYFRGTIYFSENTKEYGQLKNYVEKIFSIETLFTQINRSRWFKRYTISEELKCWDIIIGTASFLFAGNLQKYRNQLLEEENIHGVITLKSGFFEKSTIPEAVIVLGSAAAEKIWLTSATSTEDIIKLFIDRDSYHKNVYYTEKLDPENFMPEKYNGEQEMLDEALDRYETKTLKEIADIILGKSVSRWELSETGIPYLRQRDIKNGAIVTPDKFVMEDAAEKYAKQLLQEGDILLTKNFRQHKVARVTADDLPAIASNSLFIIRVFGVPDEYLYEYFTSNTGKAILDKQLSSIERDLVIASINKKDLQELRVPIFDEATMLSFSQIEDMKASDALLMLNRMNRLGAHSRLISAQQFGTNIEKQVYNDLLKAGWSKDDLQINPGLYSVDLKAGKWVPDIALFDGDNWIGAVEIKSDFSNIDSHWISKMSEVLNEAKVPCLIFSTGFYYEVHFTHKPIVKKLQEAPSKDMLLSILSGKECD